MFAQTTPNGSEKYLSAIAKGVNARGGIAGHPLQIVLCDDNNDANQATQCARQATSDPRMLGIIANSSTCSSQVLPILQRAQMASIGDQFFCPEDFKSPVVFPFNSGTLGDVAGSAAGVKYFHNPNVVVTTLDLPAGREYPPLVQGVVSAVGGKVTASVYVPITTADMSPYAQQIAAHNGVLAEGNTTAVGIRLGQALSSIGYNQPVIYNSTVWYPALFKSSFGNPTNAYISEYYNLSSPGWQQFVSDMSTYAPGSSYQGGDLVTAWLAANVVAEIAKSLPSVSAQSMFSYLTHATNLSTFGMTIPLNYTVPQTALKGLIPRAVNPNISLYHYVNGAMVQVTPFENYLP
jgi:hypothetical protein